MADDGRKRKGKTMLEVLEKKRKADRERSKTMVCLGSECFPRWRRLKTERGLATDAAVAAFLLDSYDSVVSSTPFSHKKWTARPEPPALSTIREDLSERGCASIITGVEKLSSSSEEEVLSLQEAGGIDEKTYNDLQNSIIDWDDQTWTPDMEESVSLSEDDSEEEEEDEYEPNVCVRSGVKLPQGISLNDLPVLGLDDTVHDEPEEDAAPTEPPPPHALRVVTEEDVLSSGVSMVYHDVLKHLLAFLILPIENCKTTGCTASKPFEVDVKHRGTAVIAEWICSKGHTVWKWSSQRYFKFGQLAGDFLLGMNILLSGNNFRKIALLHKFMNMGILDETAFHKIQAKFCLSNIESFWKAHSSKAIDELKSKESVVLLGDARMDSPGFCAQFCTYTTMENDTKRIVAIVNKDKRQVGGNSVAMEKTTFIETMDTLCPSLGNVKEFCTDANLQISALFNTGKYSEGPVKHSLDIWHGAKNLNKKISAVGREKGCALLLHWNKHICNHFWYCCKETTNYVDFMDMWTGVLHHVVNEHVWHNGSCQHDILEGEREWMKKGSKAHDRLRDVVFDKRWLKNIPKYLAFRSTSELESFHNHILMYASKRFSFTPKVYNARTLLAGLDYNFHLSRKPKRRPDGSFQYGRLFNKKSKMWRLYPIKENKTYAYIRELQCNILDTRLKAKRGMSEKHVMAEDDPRRLGPLAGPAPSMQELKEQLARRK